MADLKTPPEKQIIRAGLAHHTIAAMPQFGSQTVLRVRGAKESGPPGAPKRGTEVTSMKLSPRGLEVLIVGGDTVILGSGSWVYVVEVERSEP